MATTESAIVQPPQKLTVGFSRKVAVRQYESAESSIFVTQDIAGTYSDQGLFVPDEGAVKQAAEYALFEAKAAVYTSLHLPFEVVEGYVVELIDSQLGPVEVQGRASSPKTQTTKAPAQTVAGKSTKDELYASFLADPNRWWDNRVGKKNPKAPDLKHKDTGEAIWLDKASAEVKAWAAANPPQG